MRILMVRLIVLCLLIGQCRVNSFEHVKFLIDHSVHLSSFFTANKDIIHAHETISSVTATLQHALGISAVDAAVEIELPPITLPVEAVDNLPKQIPKFSLPEVSIDIPDNLELPPITLPELNAGEAAEYLGSKFGRVGSNFVKMSGLDNAPETADRLLKQSAQLVDDLSKSTAAVSDLVDGTVKSVSNIVPKNVDPETLGAQLSKEAEKVAYAADSSIKYWLDEAARTNEAAVKKVNFQLPTLPSSEELKQSLVKSLPKPDLSKVSLPSVSREPKDEVDVLKMDIDVGQATVGAVQGVATVAVGVGSVVGQAAYGLAVVTGEGVVNIIKGVADTVVVVGSGTANNVGAIATSIGKTANGLAEAAPGNAAYLAEKTNYLTNNAASGFKELGTVLQNAPTEIGKFKETIGAASSNIDASDVIDQQVTPVLSDWGNRFSRVGNKFLKMSNLKEATDVAADTTSKVVKVVQTELPKINSNYLESLKKTTQDLAKVANTDPDQVKDIIAKKAAEADSSVKFWLDEATRYNEAAVKKVGVLDAVKKAGVLEKVDEVVNQVKSQSQAITEVMESSSDAVKKAGVLDKVDEVINQVKSQSQKTTEVIESSSSM